MLHPQLKIPARSFIRKPLYPAISMLVLSIGIACIMIAATWIRDELSYDRYYENSDSIYRLTVEKNDPKTGYHSHVARSWYQWLKYIKNDIPGIREFGRFISHGETTVRIDSFVFNAKVLKAGEDFISIFSIKIIEGNGKEALKEPKTAIISRSAAAKYFGNHDPVGKLIEEYQQNSPERRQYKITAVADDLPANSHFHFDIVFAMEESDLTEWSWTYNYLMLDDNVQPSMITAQFSQFAGKYIDKAEVETLTPHLQKITDIHLESSKDRELEENGNKTILIILGSLALFVFLVSVLNFLNLQYVLYLRRQRIRAILTYAGSGFRGHLVSRLAESFAYGLISSLIGMVIFGLALNNFNILLGKAPGAGSESISSTLIVLVPLIILLITFSGSYPLLLSRAPGKYRSVVLRQNENLLHPGNVERRYKILKTLITLQYIFSISLIIIIIVVNKQVRLIMSNRLGHNQENIVCIKNLPVQVRNSYQAFRSELLANPYIIDVTSSFENPSTENLDMMEVETTVPEPKEKMLYVYPADDNFFDFYNIPLIAGRNFRKFGGNDSISEDYILNESAVRYLGITTAEAVGKPFRLKFEADGRNLFTGGTIVGVVKDFQMSSMKNIIKPYVFFQKSFWLFSAQVKYDPAHTTGVLEQIGRTWKKLYPDYPFEYDYVENLYRNIYRNELQLKGLSLSLGIIAMVLSCLGLWGITGIIYEAKTKEIGIRKINGARIAQILAWMLKDIMVIVAIAFLFAVPVSYYLIHSWLSNFAYRARLSWLIYIVAAAVTVSIALATVGFQSWKAATKNPVDSLRYE